MEEGESTIEAYQEDPDTNCRSILTTEVVLEKIPDEDSEPTGKPPTYDDVKFVTVTELEPQSAQEPLNDNEGAKHLENGNLLAPYSSKPQSEEQPIQETLQNQEPSCGVDCMYYTLLCCECSIM